MAAGVPYVRRAGAAKRLCMSVSTFLSRRKEPGFPQAVQVSPGLIAFSTEELDAWLKQQRRVQVLPRRGGKRKQ